MAFPNGQGLFRASLPPKATLYGAHAKARVFYALRSRREAPLGRRRRSRKARRQISRPRLSPPFRFKSSRRATRLSRRFPPARVAGNRRKNEAYRPGARRARPPLGAERPRSSPRALAHKSGENGREAPRAERPMGKISPLKIFRRLARLY